MANAKENYQLVLKLEALDLNRQRERKRIENRRQRAISTSLPILHLRADEKSLRPSSTSPVTRRRSDCYSSEKCAALRNKLDTADHKRDAFTRTQSQDNLQDVGKGEIEGEVKKMEKILLRTRGTTPRIIVQRDAAAKNRPNKNKGTHVPLPLSRQGKASSKPAHPKPFTIPRVRFGTSRTKSAPLLIIEENCELLQEKIRKFYQKFERDGRYDRLSSEAKGKRSCSTVDKPKTMAHSATRSISLPRMLPVYIQNVNVSDGGTNQLKRCRYLRVAESPPLTMEQVLCDLKSS